MNKSQPLAYQLSPKTLDEFIGQSHIMDKGLPIEEMIRADRLLSLVLWGPPGCGKTSLAKCISQQTTSEFISLNAVTAKVADVKAAIDQARLHLRENCKTILFIDEIHRFNKLQQDALLPETESGLITFIGATTENPFFNVIPGLLSRAQVFELHPLTPENLKTILTRAIAFINQTSPIIIAPDAVEFLCTSVNGDARKMLNILEMAVLKNEKTISKQLFVDLTQSKGTLYNEDTHYDLISAYIKSMRGSDPDAAVYWLARMLSGGEDPVFIARRMVIFASEDIGTADLHALPLALAALDAAKTIGMPEVRINLSHVTAYLASVPKSNAAYMAINQATSLIEKGAIYPVPNHLKNAHYTGEKKLGIGQGYLYPHDFANAVAKQDYLPGSHTFYEPKSFGFEKQIKKRLDAIKAWKYSEKIPYLKADEFKIMDHRMASEFGISVAQLMALAGSHTAHWIRQWIGEPCSQHRICMLCGKGHNGGDGLVAARHLANFGSHVSVILTHAFDQLSEETQKQYHALSQWGVQIMNLTEADSTINTATLIVDAIFGVGLNRAPEEACETLIRLANQSQKPIVAIDCPSGLDATLGQVFDPCIKAQATLTFAALKKGFLVKETHPYLGEIYLADIGIPKQIYMDLGVTSPRFSDWIMKIS